MFCGLLTFVTHNFDCFHIYELPRIVTLAKVICVRSVYMYVHAHAHTRTHTHTHTRVCLLIGTSLACIYVCIYNQSKYLALCT